MCWGVEGGGGEVWGCGGRCRELCWGMGRWGNCVRVWGEMWGNVQACGGEVRGSVWGYEEKSGKRFVGMGKCGGFMVC